MKIKSLWSFKILSLGTLIIMVGAGLAYSLLDPTAVNYEYQLPLLPADVENAQTEKSLKIKLEENPKNALAAAELANFYLKQARRSGNKTDFAEAEKYSALSLSAGWNSHARIVQAQLLESRHDFEIAIEACLEVLAKAPQNRQAQQILVVSYLALGKIDEADKISEILVRQQPLVAALSLRALVLIARGRYAEAEFEFNKCLSIEDLGELNESARFRALWARHKLNRGQWRHAELLLQETLRISPEMPLALDLLGQLRAQQGRWKEAEALLHRAFARSKESVYLRHLAEMDFARGNIDAGVARLDQAELLYSADLATDSFEHNLDLSRILLLRAKAGDHQRALTLATSEISKRQSSDAYFVLARSLYSLGKLDPALIAIQSALSTGQKDPAFYFLAAEIYASLKNQSRANFFTELTLQTNPKFNAKLSFK